MKTSKQQISTSVSWMLFLAMLTVNFCVAKPALSEQKEKLNLKDFDYWAGLCKSLGEEKKYEEAISACNEGIAIRPNEPEIWVIRTEILLSQEKYSDALASADKALRIKPKYSRAIAD